MERSNTHPYTLVEMMVAALEGQLEGQWTDEEDNNEDDSDEEDSDEEWERAAFFIHNGITYLRVIDNHAIYSLDLEYLGNFRNGVIVYDYTHRDPTSIIDEALWRERLH